MKKLALGAFNGWRCPTCKKLVAKPVDSWLGRCKFCGQELTFRPLTEAEEKRDEWKPPVRGDLDEECMRHIHEVNEADRIMQERYAIEARLRAERGEREMKIGAPVWEKVWKKDLGIVDTLEEMEKNVEKAQVLEEVPVKIITDGRLGVEVPVKIIKGGDSRGRPVVVNFLNRPILLKRFERIGKEKELFLSEVIIGFAAKGLKHYLEKEKDGKIQG